MSKLSPEPESVPVVETISNVSQRVFRITEDRLRLNVSEFLESRRGADWIGPCGIAVTILLALVTADFKDTWGVPEAVIRLVFEAGLLLAVFFMVRGAVKCARAMRVDDFVVRLSGTPCAKERTKGSLESESEMAVTDSIKMLEGRWFLRYGTGDPFRWEVATIDKQLRYHVGVEQKFTLQDVCVDNTAGRVTFTKVYSDGKVHHSECLQRVGENLLLGHRKGDEHHLLMYARPNFPHPIERLRMQTALDLGSWQGSLPICATDGTSLPFLAFTDNDPGTFFRPGMTWRNYLVSFRFRIENGYIGLILRAASADDLMMIQFADGKISPHSRRRGHWQKSGEVLTTMGNGPWHHCEAIVAGSDLGLYIDGTLAWSDSEMLRTLSVGTIGFRCSGYERGTISDLRVLEL